MSLINPGGTTLQINLSPGDISYAALVVPHLVASHRNYVSRVVAVVDCCRPQPTKIYDPDVRVPLEIHRDRVEVILGVASTLKDNGWLDEVYLLNPGDTLIENLLRKYFGKMPLGALMTSAAVVWLHISMALISARLAMCFTTMLMFFFIRSQGTTGLERAFRGCVSSRLYWQSPRASALRFQE